jgi:hypothetical protein
MQKAQDPPQSHTVALGASNIKNLSVICNRFFLEKHNVELSLDTLHIILPKILSKIVDHYAANPPIPPVEEVNIIAMTRLKEFVLKQQQQQQPLQQPLQQQPFMQQQQSFMQQQPSENVQQIDPIQPLEAMQQMRQLQLPPLPQMNNVLPSETSHDDETPESLVKKLQKLEHERQTAKLIVPNAPDPVDPSTYGKAPLLQPVVPVAPTIVYVPQMNADTKTHKQISSKTITINSEHRHWQYFNERASFTFSGPLAEPTSSSMMLSCLLLPTCISHIAPYVIVHIIGAGQQKEECVCVLHSCGRTWDVWKPSSKNMTLRLLALPWTINILDSNRKLLNMGCDGTIVKDALVALNHNTKLICNRKMDYVAKGQTLMFRHEADESTVTATIINIVDDNIIIEGEVTSIINSCICNLSLQASLIIEVIKNEDSDV